MGVDSGPSFGRVRLFTPTLEATVKLADSPIEQTAIRTDLGAIFVSLELSTTKWVVSSIQPGRQKISKHEVKAGETDALFALFGKLQAEALAREHKLYPIITIQEAGFDAFWVHRVLVNRGIESHVVDPASIAVPRRRRNAKTDKVDGLAQLRTLLSYKRGEPRMCSMVVPPSVEEEDRRRISRERKVLKGECIEHCNRIKGLLSAQGIRDYDPELRSRRTKLEGLTTGDGRDLTPLLKAQILRELDRLELVLEQLQAVERARDAQHEACLATGVPAMLLKVKGIGAEIAEILHAEAFYRHFGNRRQLGAYAGLAPTPWQSGKVDREQGVSKAGNPRLRRILVQLAWLWLRHQPDSDLSRWFHDRVNRSNGRQKKTLIVALARKLLVALWRYIAHGVVIEGAVMKAAPAKPA
jgi:transposase